MFTSLFAPFAADSEVHRPQGKLLYCFYPPVSSGTLHCIGVVQSLFISSLDSAAGGEAIDQSHKYRHINETAESQKARGVPKKAKFLLHSLGSMAPDAFQPTMPKDDEQERIERQEQVHAVSTGKWAKRGFTRVIPKYLFVRR